MTSAEYETSNECKSKEIDLFENMLVDEFIKLEKDYDKLDQVLDKFRQQNIIKTSPS